MNDTIEAFVARPKQLAPLFHAGNGSESHDPRRPWHFVISFGKATEYELGRALVLADIDFGSLASSFESVEVWLIRQLVLTSWAPNDGWPRASCSDNSSLMSLASAVDIT